MSSLRQNMVKLCGKTVHPTGKTCGGAGDLCDHFPAAKIFLGTTTHLSDLLYYLFTQLLHSQNRLLSPVISGLYPLSTPPTITITTNI